MSTGAAAGVAMAVAAAAELARQEEEEMTPYTDKDLAEGWEFKIVRASFASFRTPEQLRAVLEEERKGGWILVEKFDDSRIRLKRPASAKLIEGDFADGYDPYRTTVVGINRTQAWTILIVVGALFAVIIGLLLIASVKY